MLATIPLAAQPCAAATTGGTGIERARWLMGTLCTARVEAADSVAASRALDAAFDAIASLDPVLSSWRDDSELSRLNAMTPGSRITCSPSLFAALAAARGLARMTHGAFDPTVEPLSRAWDLRGEGRVPDRREIAAARARVGWRGLRLDAPTSSAAFASPGMGLDLGGIGKGFALDRAVAVLESAGITRAQMNFGGEIRSISERADWPVTVAHPLDRTRPLVAFDLRSGAVSTSGQSERSFVRAGRRYGHILDPRTGMPVEDRGSVTVVAQTATEADGLSTALFVMGRAGAEAFVRRHPEIAALWLEPVDGAVRVWRWNGLDVRVAPGAEVQWMDSAETQ